MPQGKPADVRCAQLTVDLRCALFGRPERPACCSGLRPSLEMCGETREHALAWLRDLERRTLPRRANLAVDANAPRPGEEDDE